MLIKAVFENGDSVTSRFNGSLQEAINYYLHNHFNLGLGPSDNLVKCISVAKIGD